MDEMAIATYGLMKAAECYAYVAAYDRMDKITGELCQILRGDKKDPGPEFTGLAKWITKRRKK